MQCACALLSTVACSTLQYFSNFSHTRHNFRKMLPNMRCLICFSLQVLSEMFSTHIRKILKYRISWKSNQWERSCSLRTDRRTDMAKLVVSFRKLSRAPKKYRMICSVHRTLWVCVPMYICNYMCVGIYVHVCMYVFMYVCSIHVVIYVCFSAS